MNLFFVQTTHLLGHSKHPDQSSGLAPDQDPATPTTPAILQSSHCRSSRLQKAATPQARQGQANIISLRCRVLPARARVYWHLILMLRG